jgi:CheY-like chemotaxis protein
MSSFDDDEPIKNAVAEARALAATLSSVPSTARALGCVRAAPPQVIGLDLMTPVMDGWAFVERRRAVPPCANVRIVPVSAFHTSRTGFEQLTATGANQLRPGRFHQTC